MYGARLSDCLYAFASAGRPGFREDCRAPWQERIEELRDCVRPALAPRAAPREIDDLLEAVIDEAITRAIEGADERTQALAAYLFARDRANNRLNITARRQNFCRSWHLASDRALRPRGQRPGLEFTLIQAVAARVTWPEPLETSAPALVRDTVPADVAPVPHEARLGNVQNPWLTIATGPFEPRNLELTTIDAEITYLPAVEARRREYTSQVDVRPPGDHRPTNNDCLSLHKFDVTGRTRNREEPILRLVFAKTTYFSGQVTNWQLDRPVTLIGAPTTLRKAMVDQADMAIKPISGLADIWGVILTVVTTDQWVLLPLRGATEVESNCFGPSVGEEGLWMRDVNADGTVDPFTLAAAGIDEELGASIQPEEVEWLEHGTNTICARYALIGLVRPKLTRAQLEARMTSNAKDRWEVRKAHWTKFAPESVAAFVDEPGRRFSPYAIAALSRALIHTYSWERCDQAFATVSPEIVRTALVGRSGR